MNNTALRAALFLACALAAAARPAMGQEWTRFRGPNGSGVSDCKTVPVKWTEKDYNWKTELPGSGHSSPVLWGQRIFLTCTDKDTAKRMVVCVNALDGAIVWKREYGSHAFKINPDNSYASSTAVVDESHVYVCWSTPEEFTLLALTHDGSDAWTCDLGPYKSQHGSGTSPILVNDLVVLSNDQDGPQSFLVGVDRITGKIRWKTERKSGKHVGCTPIVYRAKDGSEQVVFSSTMHGLTGIDPATGKVAWQVADAFALRCVGSPTIAGDLVVGTCGEGQFGKMLVAVRPPKAAGGKAEVAYKLTSQMPYVPTPLAFGDLLYFWSDTGIVTAVKAATGELVWQEKVGGAYYSSPICVDGKIYNVSKKGLVSVLATGPTYQLLGQSDLGELCHTTPAVANGHMYVRTFTHLISLGGK